jgi:hypothetical protein
MSQIQKFIHDLEVGGGLNTLRRVIIFVVVCALLLEYNHRAYKNMSSPEAMDTAQLARNIAEGRGYTTLFIRPFSAFLVDRQRGSTNQPAGADRALLREAHPDLANPPVYPLLLAGVMKIFPGVKYQTAGVGSMNIGIKKISWNNNDHFWIYAPDFWISVVNQLIFLLTALLIKNLAAKLFDSAVGWTSAAVFLGTDLFWRFSLSGLSTMLVLLIFLLLALQLIRMDEKIRAGGFSVSKQFLGAAAIGGLVALGCLTRYSFGVLILPVFVYMVFYLGAQRVKLALATLATFLVLLSPWVARNYRLSGAPFGTAGYAIYADTYQFPEYKLERSPHPDFAPALLEQVWAKIISNSQTIFQDELLRISGGLVGGLFLAGLLLRFSNPSISRLRWFVIFCLPVLVFAEAAGRTQISADHPVVNSENLLIILSPLVMIFGVSIFYALLDQMQLAFPELRLITIGVFLAALCMPAVLAFFKAPAIPITYPPYYPPVIQQRAQWMKEDEMTMSDIPWAVAWYGKRQSVWLTPNAVDDFMDLNNNYKTVSALYLTPVTMDARLLSEDAWAGGNSWAEVAMGILYKGEMPEKFPLIHAFSEGVPEQLFLTDRERWAKPAGKKN